MRDERRKCPSCGQAVWTVLHGQCLSTHFADVAGERVECPGSRTDARTAGTVEHPPLLRVEVTLTVDIDPRAWWDAHRCVEPTQHTVAQRIRRLVESDAAVLDVRANQR
jgi:hypothetical protein